MLNWFRQLLATRVSGASLGVFRACFGAVMLYEACWFLGVAPGAQREPNVIESLYTGEHVQWNIPYPGFEWVRPLPEPFTTGLFAVFAAASVLVLLGCFYRVAIVALFATFSYVHLLEAAAYQNHFYLCCLVGFLLIWMPADRCFSLRSLIRRLRHGPAAPAEVPFWSVFLLRGQMFLVYFFAGLAKLNPDWLGGEPLRLWLRQADVASLLARILSADTMTQVRAWLGQESTVMLMAYGGLTFDLTIGFLLLIRRTRVLALLVAVAFNAANFFLFPIGAFPITALALTLILLGADWPMKLGRQSRRTWRRVVRLRASLPDDNLSIPRDNARTPAPSWVCLGVALWLVVQVALPLRHLLIDGNPSWTEEGHRYSWQMMLRSKDPGHFAIEIVDPELPSFASPRERSGESPVYRQVSADRPPWRQLPELVVTYEPLLGERIIFNPYAAGNRLEVLTRLRAFWLDRYGVAPQFKPLVAFPQAIDALIQLAGGKYQTGDESALALQGELQTVRSLYLLANDHTATSADRQQAIFDLQQGLHRLTRIPEWRATVLKHLMQTQPFGCQGGSGSTEPFMIVVAPNLTRAGKHCVWQLERSKWQGTDEVLIDSTRLIPTDMQSLPKVIRFCDFDGRPATYWNYMLDVHPAQTHALLSTPTIQHQYAQRVARLWQAEFGRRPRVYVTSYVRMNRHAMQPLIDNTVNLAAARMHWLSHNDWILPLNGGQPSPLVYRSR